MADIAQRDSNHVPSLLAVSSVDGTSTVTLYANPTTHRLYVDLPTSGGTVTNVSIATANGFAGTVATATTTPVITLSTTITGVLKGDGTSISAATAGTDYVTASSTNTFTNKTFDTAGAGNSLSIAGVAVTANTGTGSIVRATSPTLVTPALGTPSAIVLTSGTGLPVSTGISGLGTGVATFLATPSSSNLIAAVTDETGSGALVFGTAPTLSSPVIATITNTGTLTLPTASDTLIGRATSDTLTNKRITRRFITTTQSATPTINTDNTDIASITGLAQAVTSFSTNLSGTPSAGDYFQIQITDNGTARALTWGAKFASTTITLPTTTVISTLLRVGFQWDTVAAVWQCIAVA